MLGLLTPTDPSWVQAVEGDLDRLLSDHAHCELKAAQSALALVARFGGEAPEIVEPLLELAREEMQHFEAVRARSGEDGRGLELPEADDYVVALRKSARQDHTDYPVLLDRLLIHALIEARSCERFSVLAEGLKDLALQEFYRSLMESEARHYALFRRLAEARFGAEATRTRFAQLTQREASIAAALPLGPTVHG